MKKAREVADRVLAEWLAGLRPHTRGLIVSRLFDDFAKAGFVILPREPDEGMIHTGAASLDYPSVFMGGPSQQNRKKIAQAYRAMVQHYESKGEAE